jgi:hypothetical protein
MSRRILIRIGKYLGMKIGVQGEFFEEEKLKI